MPKIKDVVKILEDFAPLELQASYDNSGLFFGDYQWDLKGVLITLDTSEDVVKEAIELGANLIIEHHPSVFMPIKKIDLTYPKHRAIALAIKNDIAIYSAHTSVDFAVGGLNDRVMELLGCVSYDQSNGNASDMRIGKLIKAVKLGAFADCVAQVFDDKHVAFVGDSNKLISTIAVVNGGGGSHEGALVEAKNAGADVFVSGDFKYNVIRFAKDLGFPVIIVGHYNSEVPFFNLIRELLINNDICNVHSANTCTNPLN